MEITALYNRFHKLLYNYIAVRVKNRQDVEDLLQEVFVRIFLNLKKLEKSEQLNSWIFSITRNAIIDYYRKNSGSRNRSMLIDDLVSDSLSPEEETDATKGLDQCLRGFIHQLPEDYRAILFDSEINGIRQKDLAVKYNIAYPTLRSKVQRGRARLKVLLGKCCKIAADRHGNILESTPRTESETRCGPC